MVTVDTNNGTILNWVVYVRDANGCTTNTPVTILGDPAPAAPVVTVPNQCTATGNRFTIQVTAAAGSLTPLTYGIVSPTGAFQAANTFTVAPGTYTVYVKDRNGCVSTGTAVTVASQLTANAVVTKTLDCTSTPNATITTTITGGGAPFTYTVQKGTGAPSANTPVVGTTFTTSVSNANADTYTFVITDANNCTTTTTATVIAISDPTVNATPTQVSCFGGNNGSVTLTGAGGSGGYMYSFDGSPYATTATYTGLSANILYPYQVRDSKGCVSAIGSITLTQPSALVVSAGATTLSCNPTTNANQSAVVTINQPTTGTSPYQYSFNGGAYSAVRTLTVNDNGLDQTIPYSVRDAQGCTTPGSITINRLNKPVIGTITNTPIYCAPAATTSTVTIPVTSGTGVGTLTYAILAPVSGVRPGKPSTTR